MKSETIAKEKKILQFIETLESWNCKFNLMSNQIQREQIEVLIQESILLGNRMEGRLVVDAGSGNGVLGIPLAITFPEKTFVLIEKLKKKADFLQTVKTEMNIGNARVSCRRVEEELKELRNIDCIITRGFPKLELLLDYVATKRAKQLIAITSQTKTQFPQNKLVNTTKTIYNVPNRDRLVICVWNRVSRETKGTT